MRLSEKERRWNRAWENGLEPAARRRRRYRCTVCYAEKLVKLTVPTDQYAHRLACQQCRDISIHAPIGARTLEARRHCPRNQIP